MDEEKIRAKQEKDREELASLPGEFKKTISWCNEHDCETGICFPYHYRESFASNAPIANEGTK